MTNFYDPDTAIFTDAPASVANSIAIASGNWVTDFKNLGISDTGKAVLYPDHRLKWLRNQFGDFKGKSVLELGSLEGAHTLQFEEFGCREVIGIEANQAHFMKALIIKNVVYKSNIKFLLGNFQSYLQNCKRTFDMVSACGVLYHMVNPVEIIALCADVADSIFIWTVIYNEEMCPPAHKRLITGKETIETRGFAYEGYKHYYRSTEISLAKKDKNFSGGLDSYAIWLEKDELLRSLRHFGFVDIVEKTNNDNPRHGQNIQVLARKTK